MRKFPLILCVCVFTIMRAHSELRVDGYYVTPGEEIQSYLDAAATNSSQKRVVVRAGTYAPSSKRQALIWLNRRHEGIHLEAEGAVTLTAQNQALAGQSATNTAIVNHVIYIGHGITSNTVIKGFRVTGANAFCTKGATRRFEPDESVPKNLFFFTDGGAIKVFGRASPILLDLLIEENFSSPCAGGISVQQQKLNDQPVIIRNCIFQGNKAQVTGAAVDLLSGSAATIENCLFLHNASNLGEDVVARVSKEKPFTNSGVVTVFEGSSLLMKNCTFTANRNAIDDRAGKTVIENSIFFDDHLESGLQGNRYELELTAGSRLTGCTVNGTVRHRSLKDEITEQGMRAPEPNFNETWVPRNQLLDSIGYRPTRRK
ncbi:MAG: hypothetical protein JWM99_655 [Verrucomicrobiales bacterium]|nr:hypothetical protein [Verrucomicrobiales bacterium]